MKHILVQIFESVTSVGSCPGNSQMLPCLLVVAFHYTLYPYNGNVVGNEMLLPSTQVTLSAKCWGSTMQSSGILIDIRKMIIAIMLNWSC